MNIYIKFHYRRSNDKTCMRAEIRNISKVRSIDKFANKMIFNTDYEKFVYPCENILEFVVS